MSKSLAILAAKAATSLNRITGSGGTALPGLVAKKLSPNILNELTAGNFPKGTVVVTGTNGKTTTTRLIASTLDESGLSYVHNRSGSNLERGIIASLLQNSSLSGKIEAGMGLFEVDEAYVPMVCRAIQPSFIVVTNLFRDQLDRYGELDSIASSFKDLFIELPDTHFILNADDPLVASLGLVVEDKNRVHYYGINQYTGPKLHNDHTADSIFSPVSQEPLIYSQQYFSHIGIYRSKNGDFKRPKCEFYIESVEEKGSESISFIVNKTSKVIKLPLAGLYNVYNALAAYSLASLLGIKQYQIESALEQSAAAFGRAEEVSFDEKKWLLLLIKNPTGFNQIIQTYLLQNNQNTIWIIINDNLADGRDVSWLWDVAIEDIAAHQGEIVVSGTRAYDMALRLKYAGLENVKTEVDIEKGLDFIQKSTGKRSRIFVLPTYTAMRALRSELVKLAGISKEYSQ